MGPNVKKLIFYKASIGMVPSGGFETALVNLTTPGKLQQEIRDAKLWVEQAIATVKTSPDNHYKTDDEIAKAILDKIKENKCQLPS